MKQTRKIGASAILISFMVIGMLVAMQVVPNAINRNWGTVSAADGNPGTGASGVLEIFIYAHAANPNATYATNLSSVSPSCYAARNTLNGACAGNVPYATTFDIVVKVRYNATHAYNTTGSVWMPTWTKALITSANLAIGADTEMFGVTTGSNTTYLWRQFYIQDANGGLGAGFTITHGQVVNVTSFKMQAYF